MKRLVFLCLSFVLSAAGFGDVNSRIVPFHTRDAGSVVLQNDDFNEKGSDVVVQLGFVTGEKAGIWVKVPESIPFFKVESFRVLLAGPSGASEAKQVFFQMAVADNYSTSIPGQLENAAQLTAGPFWNDVPAQGAEGQKLCAHGGQLVGAALEFTHDGVPSVGRDNNGIKNVQGNVLYAIPGGWNYSSMFGITGDWVLRVVGKSVSEAECK